MSLKTTSLTALLALVLLPCASSARNAAVYLDFNSAVQQAVKAGVLDGSVRFYLAGTRVPGNVNRLNEAVSNRKTNAFKKSDNIACDQALRSVLIRLQNEAKHAGANAVVDIVSFYKRNEYRDTTKYECRAGGVMAGVALKGTIAKIK